MVSQSRSRLQQSSKRIIISAACLLGALGAACGGATEQDDFEPDAVSGEPQTQAIHDGKKEKGHPAVGQFDGAGFTSGKCSGTLVAPGWVLTARHCKDLVHFMIGPDEKRAKKYRLAEARYMQPTGAFGEPTLVRLAEEVRDVAPMPLSDDPLSHVGQYCTAVGFGLHNNEAGPPTRGVKRSAIMKVTSANRTSILGTGVTGTIDGGDSGGPLLCKGKVVGVARTREPDWSPIDAKWIRETIANPPPYVPEEEKEPGPAEPEQPSYAPELRLEGYSGTLCPEQSLSVEEDAFMANSPEPLSHAAVQSCKLQLSLVLPAGRQFEKPVVCSMVALLGSASQASVKVSYTSPGVPPLQQTRTVVNGEEQQACDTLDLSADTCSDPSQALTIPLTVEFSGSLKAGSTLVLSSVERILSGSEGAPCASSAD